MLFIDFLVLNGDSPVRSLTVTLPLSKPLGNHQGKAIVRPRCLYRYVCMYIYIVYIQYIYIYVDITRIMEI